MHCRLKFDIDWPKLVWALAGPSVSSKELRNANAFFQDAFPGFEIVAALSVRTLLDSILSEFSLPPRSPILMSGITIRHMADIAETHGLLVVPVDIEPDTLLPRPGDLLKSQAETGARLCVVAQLYGAASNIADAPTLRERGVTVIEDAAQSFDDPSLSRDRGADVSLLSFGPIKRRTALGGALGLFRDSDFATSIRNRLVPYPKHSDYWLRKRALKYSLLKAASAPFTYNLLLKAIAAAGLDPDSTIAGMARGFSDRLLLEAIRHAPPPRMLALMARQIRGAPSSATRVASCESFLAGSPAITPGTAAQQHFHWVLPVMVSNPREIVEVMRFNGFDATRGATSLCALAPDETPSAKALIDHVIYLPHPAEMNPVERTRMQTVLAGAISKYGAPAE